MTLYFLSGLGADKRIFQKLHLPDHYSIIHVEWIKPLQNESIANYALRLSASINRDEAFGIIGLSFGGIMALELSKIVSLAQTIIISSISSKKQLPPSFSIMKFLFLHKFIPERFLKIKNKFVYWFMGARTIREKAVFNQILKDTEITFFRWAISSILHWKHTAKIPNLYHIHGTSDNIFPIEYTSPDYKIEGGGHLMVYSNATEVSSILTNILKQ
jgi:hypothetical protein